MFNNKTNIRIVNAAEQLQLQILIKPLDGRRAATAEGVGGGVNQLSLFPPKVIRSELPFSLDTFMHMPKIGNKKKKKNHLDKTRMFHHHRQQQQQH